MATPSLTLSVSQPRFGRPESTEIRANFARDVLADMKAAYFADDRLKIHPVSDFIKSVVDRSGAVLVVLAAFKPGQSNNRLQAQEPPGRPARLTTPGDPIYLGDERRKRHKIM